MNGITRWVILAGLALALGMAPGEMPAWASGGGHGGAEKAPAHGAGADESEGEEAAAPIDPTEVTMPPVIVPVTRDKTLIGYLYVGVVLKGSDVDAAKQIGKAMPLYQDATLRAMNDTPVPVENAETEATKAELLERLDAVLKHVKDAPAVQSVRIQDILSAPF